MGTRRKRHFGILLREIASEPFVFYTVCVHNHPAPKSAKFIVIELATGSDIETNALYLTTAHNKVPARF